jgi:hypothetical protein
MVMKKKEKKEEEEKEEEEVRMMRPGGEADGSVGVARGKGNTNSRTTLIRRYHNEKGDYVSRANKSNRSQAVTGEE